MSTSCGWEGKGRYGSYQVYAPFTFNISTEIQPQFLTLHSIRRLAAANRSRVSIHVINPPPRRSTVGRGAEHNLRIFLDSTAGVQGRSPGRGSGDEPGKRYGMLTFLGLKVYFYAK